MKKLHATLLEFYQFISILTTHLIANIAILINLVPFNDVIRYASQLPF